MQYDYSTSDKISIVSEFRKLFGNGKARMLWRDFGFPVIGPDIETNDDPVTKGKLLATIRREGLNGITLRTLHRRYQRFVSSGDLKKTLVEFENSGEVRSVISTPEGGGRETITYYPILK